MKNILLMVILLSLSLSSCKENERMVYNDKAGLYFGIIEGADSISFSFTMVKEDQDTLNLFVRLLGQPTNYDRKFKIKLNEGSTAIANKHFKALESEYTLEKNKVSVNVPIYIFKTADLETNIVSLDFSIVEDDVFSIGYLDKNRMRYFITNQLVKPSYWDSPLSLYFGEYSKVKHQVCVDIMGGDFPLKQDSANNQYYMRVGRTAAMYFALNEVYDENGRRIETWDPF